MIRCLVTGRLHDMPQARTSANGNTLRRGSRPRRERRAEHSPIGASIATC